MTVDASDRYPSDGSTNRLPYGMPYTMDNESIMQDSANQPGFLFHDYAQQPRNPRD
ncbi:hypothetical protein ACXG8N_002121 [Klebsiella aerogenes]